MIYLSFGEWWIALTSVEQIFWGISLVSSIFFFILFVVSLLGFDADTDVDMDMDVDMDHGGIEVHGDFSVFSIRAIVAFFTFFGWGGVLILKDGGSTILATLMGLGSGLVAMFIVGYMLYLFSKLDESGTTDVENALYEIGEVYFLIPQKGDGMGKVNVKVEGTLREYDAITEDNKPLATGSKIRVIDILENNVLVVEAEEILLEK